MHVNIQTVGEIFTKLEKDTLMRAIIAGMKGVQYALLTLFLDAITLCGEKLYKTPVFMRSLLSENSFMLNTSALTKECKTPCIDLPTTTASGFATAFMSPEVGSKEN